MTARSGRHAFRGRVRGGFQSTGLGFPVFSRPRVRKLLRKRGCREFGRPVRPRCSGRRARVGRWPSSSDAPPTLTLCFQGFRRQKPRRARVDDELRAFSVTHLDQGQGVVDDGCLEAGRCFGGAGEEAELIGATDSEHRPMMPKSANAAQGCRS